MRPTLLILAEISLKRHNSKEFTRFESTIRNIPEIVEAAQVSGQFDYLLKVVVPDIRAWRELAGRLQDGESGVEKVHHAHRAEGREDLQRISTEVGQLRARCSARAG